MQTSNQILFLTTNNLLLNY